MAQGSLLENIKTPEDLKALSVEQCGQLCWEIRDELIRVVSQNGGHLASNLGVVELTVALHRQFHSPEDRIVFDVGHQCYTHKLLTGRREQFATLRKENGLSGFTRPSESVHDTFVSGHSSTSISAAFGIAVSNALKGDSHYVVAVIGDGALTGGLSYEALNNAGRTKSRLIVIINDNKMSISKNVGAMARHLALIRARPSYFRFKSDVESALLKIPRIGRPVRNFMQRAKLKIKNAIYDSTIFEDMGFAYLGPIDGHDLVALETCLMTAKAMKRPVVIHIHTVKGKGYRFAEQNPKDYHGVSAMDIETGECPASQDSFSFHFGQYLVEEAAADRRICAVTAAMTEGTGLAPFREQFRERFFDVGIAEEHAVTFCSGLAKNGMIPVFAVYSSFLQRAYDQIIHDVAIQGLKVVLCVDRAGFVGEDGETHQGLFDVSFLNAIPRTTIYAPTSYTQLQEMLHKALQDDAGGLQVLRYPRGKEPSLCLDGCRVNEGYTQAGAENAKICIVCYGRVFSQVLEAVKMLQKVGITAAVINLDRIRPLPNVYKLLMDYPNLLFLEEGIQRGGIGETMAAFLAQRGYHGRIRIRAVDDCFVPQASVASCLRQYGLDAQGIFDTIIGEYGGD